MREIKFRVWVESYRYYDDEKERYIVVPAHMDYQPTAGQIKTYSREFIYDGGIVQDAKLRLNEACFTIKNLMQYTGLKDRKKREIWEGDILKIGAGLDFIAPVSYEPGYFGVWEPGDDNERALGFYGLNEICCDGLEVIGNIHENPELLK